MRTVDFDRLDLQPGHKILDIGCGTGRHTCAAYALKKVVVVGADIDAADVCETRERLKLHDQLGEHGGGVWNLATADINYLPFKDHAFDLVICSEVLEHLVDETRPVSELVRVLKPGKNLVVSVPRYGPEYICWWLSDEYHSASDGHVRIFRTAEIAAVIEQAGLRKWSYHFAHSLHSPYWWLKCLVGPARQDSRAVNLYHRFLTWDMMRKPLLSRFLDKLLNPILGKSVVLYFRK
jgi:ubiquinone/menaquinone biosynthesis C-methylase UbiE